MAETEGLSPIVESKADLIEDLAIGCKPKEAWRIGTEHEKFGYHAEKLTPLQYEGDDGVNAVLVRMQRFGWEPIEEGGYLIALKKDGASISLEPGGQFELSGAPLSTLHETCREVHTHLDQVKEVSQELGLGFLGVGFSPKWKLADTPIMPKDRYKIMRAYMQSVGSLGREMMFRSCTVQVNLDFASEADMVKKFRVGLALQPIVTAMFANSPFTEGKPNGFQSYRSRVWLDTDNDRTGMLPFVFEDGFSFEQYTDYALDVPMYFVYRDGIYHDVTGKSFRDFMNGKLEGFEGQKPFLSDWDNHLTTIFPEVRMKQFLEMRGADGGPWKRLCALPALWVGVLYHQPSLDAAWDLVKDWTEGERQDLREQVPVSALKTPFRNQSVHEIAKQILALSYDGLRARNILDRAGDNETQYLETLEQILESGQTASDEMLARYESAWQGDINKIFEEYSY